MMAGHNPFGRTEERYGANRHPGLPWGYWLISSTSNPGGSPLIDEDGKIWQSVREAFWVDRLGFPPKQFTRSQHVLEFIASYLAIADGRFVEPKEHIFDIFRGDRHLAEFFKLFLTVAGLLSGAQGGLTPEGRAVLMMLIATRTEGDADDEVGMRWIVANQTVEGRRERDDAARRVQIDEQVAARMLHRFTTDTIGGMPAIKLIGLRITREIPVRSTMWSATWPVGHDHARNRFYAWLVERIDRWDDWSAMVIADGARALSEHLMKLAFCDRFIGERR